MDAHRANRHGAGERLARPTQKPARARRRRRAPFARALRRARRRRRVPRLQHPERRLRRRQRRGARGEADERDASRRAWEEEGTVRVGVPRRERPGDDRRRGEEEGVRRDHVRI